MQPEPWGACAGGRAVSGGRGPAGRVGAARCRSGTERLSQAALLEPEALCRGRRVRTQCPGPRTDGAAGLGGPQRCGGGSVPWPRRVGATAFRPRKRAVMGVRDGGGPPPAMAVVGDIQGPVTSRRRTSVRNRHVGWCRLAEPSSFLVENVTFLPYRLESL